MKNCLKNALCHALIATAFIYGSSLNATEDRPQELNDEQYSACGALMCLVAWADECSDYLNPFFAIEAFMDFPPRYNPFETLDLREIFLSLCPGASNEDIRRYNTSRRGGFGSSGVFDTDGRELTYREVYILEREHDIIIIEEY